MAFWPLRMKSSPSRTATVDMPMTSVPAPGSVIPMQPTFAAQGSGEKALTLLLVCGVVHVVNEQDRVGEVSQGEPDRFDSARDERAPSQPSPCLPPGFGGKGQTEKAEFATTLEEPWLNTGFTVVFVGLGFDHLGCETAHHLPQHVVFFGGFFSSNSADCSTR